MEQSGIELMLADIQKRLVEKIPALKYIDEDWGQLDYYSPNPPVKWPCALIDVFNVDWSNDGNRQQEGTCTVIIQIADLRLSNSSNAAPVNQKTKNNSFFKLVSDVYKNTMNYSGNNTYSPLVRVRQLRVKRDDGVRLYELHYTCTIKDASASDKKLKVKVSDFSTKINGDFVIL